MYIIFLCLVILILPNTILAWGYGSALSYFSGAIKSDTGCTLDVPDDVKHQREATGKPLLIYLDFKVAGVRDIPNQGGSFGIDLK